MRRETFPDASAWQRGRAWRKLPYVKARWDGPLGETQYLADRDYRAIAYRAPDGRWLPAKGCTLRRSAMLDHGEYVYSPDVATPRGDKRLLADLLERCARHPSTAWLVQEADACPTL